MGKTTVKERLFILNVLLSSKDRGGRALSENEEEGIKVSMPVRKSSISSVEGGIARIHTSHMDMFEDDEHPMGVISHEKKSIVVKIVSDRLAPKGHITLRSGDIEELDVDEGEEVTLEPYSKLTDELKSSWKKFTSRFKKEEEEGDE